MLNFYLAFLLFGCISPFEEWTATNPLLHYDPFCQLQLPHRISPSGQCLPSAFSSPPFGFCGFSPPFWHFNVRSLLNISELGQIPWPAFEREFPKCKIRQLICAELGRPCMLEKWPHNLKLNWEHWMLIPRKFCDEVRQNCPTEILPDLANAPWQCAKRSANYFIGMEKKMRTNLEAYRRLLFHGKCKKENAKWMDKIGKGQNLSKIEHQFEDGNSLDFPIWIALYGIFTIALNILGLQIYSIQEHQQNNFPKDFCWPSLLIAVQFLAIIFAKFFWNLAKSHLRCLLFALLMEFMSIFAQILSILQFLFWCCQKLERIGKIKRKSAQNRRQSPSNSLEMEIEIPPPPKSPPPKTPVQKKWERKRDLAFRICFSLAFALAICAISGWNSEATPVAQFGGCRLSGPVTAEWVGAILLCWILFSFALAISFGKIFGGQKFSAILAILCPLLLFMPFYFSLKGQEMIYQMPKNIRANLLETVRCHLQFAIAPKNDTATAGQFAGCSSFSNDYKFWPFFWLFFPPLLFPLAVKSFISFF